LALVLFTWYKISGGRELKTLTRIAGIVVLSIAGFLFLHVPAMANSFIPIPSAFTGASTPFLIGIMAWGSIFILILIIETIVLARVCSLVWHNALWAAIALNIASAVGGVVVGFFLQAPYCFCLIAIVPVALLFGLARRKELPRWYGYTLAAAIIIGYLGSIWNTKLGYDIPHWRMWFAVFLPVLLGFGLTLAFEALFAKTFIDSDKV
jgi:hypothetical protein